MSQKDEESKKLIRELEKNLALFKQKDELVEADYSSAKEKLYKLTLEFKILSEDYNAMQEELEKTKNELAKRSDVDKEEYEKLAKDIVRKDKKISDLKNEKVQMMNDWKIEKGYMEKQIKLAEGRVKENKKMNEFILKALNSKIKNALTKKIPIFNPF